MIVEKQEECRLAGETGVIGENLPQRHFRPSQNPKWPDPGLNPGRRGGKPATNRFSYGAAITLTLKMSVLTPAVSIRQFKLSEPSFFHKKNNKPNLNKVSYNFKC
jgi:hypothetical protein